MTVGQVAKRFAIPKKTIREYADKGVIRSYRSSANNYRYFEKKEVEEDLQKLNIYSKY